MIPNEKVAELIVNRAMIDERISFLKEQINQESKRTQFSKHH